MPTEPPERLHADLVDWGVLEPDPPIRFTRRFRGALARAAADLRHAEVEGRAPAGSPIDLQAGRALERHLAEEGKSAGSGHVAFVRAVHAASLPEAVRRLLGA